MATIKEILSQSKTGADAIELLKEDHRKVKDIFERFEQACEKEDVEECRTLAEQGLIELSIHAKIEEELYYPAVRAAMKEEEDLMDEALEEHHAAKLLITELVEGSLKGRRWEAKFAVVTEMVKHHIEEEEGRMFPQARKAGLDFEQLGNRMLERKRELMGELSSLGDLKRFEKESLQARGSPARPRRAAARRTTRTARSSGRGGARRAVRR